MNYMKSCFKAFLLVSLLFGMLQAHADNDEAGKLKKIEVDLNLSSDQMKKINAIKEKYATQMKELSAAVCEKRVAFQDAFKSSQKGPDFQKVLEAKFTQYSQAKSAEKLTGVRMAMEIREILNTEQIIKFNEIHNPAKAQAMQCGASAL